jgi:hypothetical protein
MQEFAKQRSAEARQETKTQHLEHRERLEDHLESLRLAEVKRCRSKAAVLGSLPSPGSTKPNTE